MKKDLISIRVLLSLVIATMVLAGCNSTPAPLSSPYQTSYLLISDLQLDGALEGFHFKNHVEEDIGIVIKEIFANNSKSEAGKTVVFAWDGSDQKAGNDNYWGFSAGTVANSEWSSGVVPAPAASDMETYITGFATPAFAEHTYVGFIAKNLSDTVKADHLSFWPIQGGDNVREDRKFEFGEKFEK